MTPIAIGLVVASAFAHAGWNTIARRRPPGPSSMFVPIIDEAIAVAPLRAAGILIAVKAA